MNQPDFPPVTPPSSATAAAARERQGTLTKPPGALGRLEELSVWVASCQNVCPPTQFERARVVVFAGDHGVARSGVSAFPPEVTAQMVANFQAGGAAINVLAGIAGASVRVVDIAVDTDAPDGTVDAHKVRRGSGDISVEDALTPDEAAAAVAAGRAIADEEVDAGADLLIAGGGVRPVLEVAGVTDILTKSIGTSNKHNVIHATIVALKALRSVEQVAKTRGKSVSDFQGVRKAHDMRG